MDSFERFARAGVELAGLDVDDVDIAVMRAAHTAYGPGFEALDAADLSEVLTETDLDPARPPSDR